MRYLIFGLPGSGKTTYARGLVKELEDVVWLNADDVRRMYDDWDFSVEGRIRQALRLRDLADNVKQKNVVCDFVAPLERQREIFSPDYRIWMDTIKESRFPDTNLLFEPPKEWDVRITGW